MEKYEQPGGDVRSKVPSKEYKDNYDRIFRKESWNDAPCSQCGVLNKTSDFVCKNCGSPV